MQIKEIKLENWRNHASLKFDFNGTTIFIGKNATGKTNFLEAIYYLACGKSFRAKDENLVNWDSDFCRLSADIEKNGKREDLLVVLEKRNRVIKTVKIKGVKKPSSHLLGNLNCVLFAPEEIELISSLPEARRRYLNLTISQTSREYAHNLVHYKRVLEQRNSLLRRINDGLAKESELEIWDGKLAEYAGEIIKSRKEFINEINQTLSDNYKKISGKEQALKINYLPSIGDEWAGMIEKLTQNRAHDIITKVTNIGPHRDDFKFLLDGRDVSEFASRGEFRTVVLALKLSEVLFFNKITGEAPVLLLDDVFSELDESRRDYLSQVFANQQTIVTTTDFDHVSKNILKSAKIVEL